MNAVQLNLNNCTFCLETIDVNDRSNVETKCKHVFHNTCLNTWLSQNNFCPSCRQANPLNERNIVCVNAKSAIQGLKRILDSLSNNSESVRSLMNELESQSIVCKFPISFPETVARNIVGPVFFNMYAIHLNEMPVRLTNDLEYGRKAFLNIDGFHSENSDRTRCLQRVICEVALTGLVEAIRSDLDLEMREFLDVLESVSLQGNDRPNGNANIAHLIYKTLYQDYSLFQALRPHLIAPHAPIFRNDFGRVAFRNEVNQRSPLNRIEVIEKTCRALYATWNPYSIVPPPVTPQPSIIINRQPPLTLDQMQVLLNIPQVRATQPEVVSQPRESSLQ